MKKKIISLCLVLALALTAIGGATLAYFTDKDQVNNTFSIGDVKIDLYEKTDIDGDGILEDQKFQEYLDYSNIMPGDALPKQAHIKNESSTNAAYVRVAVVMNNADMINDAIDDVYETKGYTAEQIQAVYDNVFDGWGMSYTKRSDASPLSRRLWMKERTNDAGVLFGGQIDMYCKMGNYGMYDVNNAFKSANDTNDQGFDYHFKGYYADATKVDERIYVFYLKLDAGEDYTLFEGLNAPKDFSNNAVQYKGKDGAADTIINQMDMFKDLKIGIYADAIQVAGFENDATAAFEQLQIEHPLGWWNA